MRSKRINYSALRGEERTESSSERRREIKNPRLEARESVHKKATKKKVGKKVTLKAKLGQKKITFKQGGLHASLGVPQGQKIPSSKFQAALAGKYGTKAKKEAQFKQNVLVGR